MTAKIIAVFIIFILFILSSELISQNSGDLSKIIPGKKYKFTLFDDTEINGKMLGTDSSGIRIETDNRNIVIIPKSNILYYSAESMPSKYRACFSLLGGMTVPIGDSYNDVPYSVKGPNFNASVMFFLSDTKATKIDAGFSYLGNNINHYAYPVGEPDHPASYSGGNYSLYSLKFNILFGLFSPEEKFTYYGSLGTGIHLIKQQDFYADYWDQYYPGAEWRHYSEHYTYPYEVRLLLSFGASMGYRISKNFGIKGEIEYNLASILIFDGKSYFPFRAGVFYVF